MTDVKKLRKLAVNATFPSSEWDSEHPASDEWKANKENNLAWCRAANPQAIIEVLDRLELYEKALEKIPLTQFWAEAAVVAREALEGGKP